MKISFVAQDLVGQGVQYATAMMARAFAADGWDVDVVVSKVHADYVREGKKPFPVPASVKLICLPDRRSSRNIFAMRKYLRTCGSDVVIAESWLYALCIACATLGIRRRRLPFLAEVIHGNEELELKWFRRVVLALKYRLVYRKFGAVMFVNEMSRRNFGAIGGFTRRLHLATVNNAIVDDEFCQSVRKPVSHPWLRTKECPTFVIAGSYTAGKRHMDAIKAIALARKRDRVRLIVYGRGPLEAEYRAYIAENGLEDTVSVAGFSNTFPAEVAAADCLLSTSDEESFGITIVEALACGTPVISTDCPYGPREILQDGRYGVLVPVGDVEAIAAAVTEFLHASRSRPDEDCWRRYTVEAVLRKYRQALCV